MEKKYSHLLDGIVVRDDPTPPPTQHVVSVDPYLTAAILFAAVALGVYLLIAAFKKVKS